jgi:hypothetical protein
VRELLSPEDPRAARAPRHVLDKAAERASAETRILHVVWDQEDGYPETGWGFEQWSVRPYRVGQGCDGTIECNMHFVALALMPALGIDYRKLYTEASPGATLEGWPSPEQAARLAAETTVPEPDADALERLLHDLYDTNHRTLEDLLRSRLESLGHLRPTHDSARPGDRTGAE